MSCTGTPISWLRLERYALGELHGAAAREIADHVAACPGCRGALARIEGDARALPPLRASAARPRWWPRLAWSGGLVAAAVALLVLVLARRGGAPESAPPAGERIKGVPEIVVSLVRERDGVVSTDPRDFVAGDRFKVQVSCPPAAGGAPRWFEVVVIQPGEPAAFPLRGGAIPCGNDVVLPGAFRLTGGGPAQVCVSIAGAPIACRTVEPRQTRDR